MNEHKLLIPKPSPPIRDLITIGCLPSGLKKWWYRRRGHRFGKDVNLGIGSVIIGENVHVEDGVRLGPGVIIRGRDVHIGRGTHIGMGTIISCRAIDIGEDAAINDRVLVTAGDHRIDSTFHLGSRTTLMRHSYVNCRADVTIGDGTGVGGHCLLFTHGYWLNWFHGYPRQLAPIHLGRDVWLPWRVFVLPGAKIGEGAVIGANSVVSGDIPPFALAAGSPAKVLRENQFAERPGPHQVAERLEQLLSEFREIMMGGGMHVKGSVVRDPRGADYRLAVVAADETPPAADSLQESDVVLALSGLSDEWRTAADRCHIAWFDLQTWERSDRQNALGNELVTHFSGYGVRFRRC